MINNKVTCHSKNTLYTFICMLGYNKFLKTVTTSKICYTPLTRGYDHHSIFASPCVEFSCTFFNVLIYLGTSLTQLLIHQSISVIYHIEPVCILAIFHYCRFFLGWSCRCLKNTNHAVRYVCFWIMIRCRSCNYNCNYILGNCYPWKILNRNLKNK